MFRNLFARLLVLRDVRQQLRAAAERRRRGPRLDLEVLEKRWLMSTGVTEYAVPAGGPGLVTVGPDNNLWFTEAGGVAKSTTGGTITEYTFSGTVGGTIYTHAISDLTAGPDGNIWFTDTVSTHNPQGPNVVTATAGGYLGKIATSGGTPTLYALPSSATAVPKGITVGPDGNLWFVDSGNNKVGKSTTGGTITVYSIPSSSSGAFAIAAIRDGNLWFTETTAGKIAKVTTSGSVTEYSTPSGGGPKGIAAGPDGNVWFTENTGNKIGRSTLAGVMTEFSVPTASSGPYDINPGPDGNVWFTENTAAKVGLVTPQGTVIEVAALTATSKPQGVVAGPDNKIWLGENATSKLGRLDWILDQVAISTWTDPTRTDSGSFGAYGAGLLAGNVLAGHDLDLNVTPGAGCGCGQAKLVYDSATVVPQPIFAAIFDTSAAGSVPTSLQARLTFNGTAGSWITFTTTGHAVGDKYLLAIEAPSGAVTATGLYTWQFDLQANFTSDTISRTLSGSVPIVDRDASPYGAGWNVSAVDQVVAVTGGVLYAYGAGGVNFFQTLTTGTTTTYLSPPDDTGTLVKNADGTYTYTTLYQTKRNFDTSGRQVTVATPASVTTSFTYQSTTTRLATVADPDGSVATFGYDGANLLNLVQEPGSRSVTVTHSGSDLTGLVNPDGALRTLGYDTGHRLTGDQWVPTRATFTYDTTNHTLTAADLGTGTTLTLAAAAAQGLQTSPAKNASAFSGVLSDALGHVSSYVPDALGRRTGATYPDGGVEAELLNFRGDLTKFTDPLNHVTSYGYDTLGNRTLEQYPDGGLQTFQYDPTWNQPTLALDPLGNRTTSTYDGTTGDLLTVKDALGNVTTNTWSAGLLQTTKDQLGHVTTYQYNVRQLQDTVDALGERTTYGYDTAGNQATVQDALGHVTSFQYDALRRLTQTIAADGGTTTSLYDGNGDLLSTTDPLGHTTSYGYDALARQVRATEAWGTGLAATTTTLYDAQGRVLSVTDPDGNVTSFAYDTLNRQTQVINGYGSAVASTTTMLYDLAGNLLSETTGSSTTAAYDHHTTTSYAYDTLNRQTQVIAGYGTAAASTTTMLYDLAGNLLSETTGSSTTTAYDHHATTSYAYDVLNRQNKVVNGYGTAISSTTTMIFDAAGNLLSETTGSSTTAAYDHHTTTSYAYDTLNRQTQSISGWGTAVASTTTMIFDAAGNLLSETSGSSTTVAYDHHTTTSYAYDTLNRQIQRIDGWGTAVASTTTMLYDLAGRLLSETTGASTTVAYDNHSTTSFAYDALNRQTQEIRAFGVSGVQQTWQTSFDTAGNVLTKTDPRGTVTSFAYDALNRQTTETDAVGVLGIWRTTTIAYDAANEVVQTVDALGYATTFAYDALDRQITEQTPAGGTITTTYDAASEVLARTDQLNHTTSHSYDALHRTVTDTDATNHITTYAFDAASNRLTLTDADNNVTTFAYDVLERLTQQTDPLNHSSTFAYDAANELLSTNDRNGRRRDLTYDALHRETAETWTGSGSTVNLLTFTFDAAGDQLTAADYHGAYTMVYDALRRMTSEQEPFGQALTMTYDGDNNRTQVQDALGGTTTSIYDALNRLVTREFGGPSQTPLREDFQYTARDQMSMAYRYTDLAGTVGAGMTSYLYDTAMRLTNLTDYYAGGSVLASYLYQYDQVSRLTTEVDNGGATIAYSYDTIDELTAAGATTYGYDPTGNRTNTGYTTGVGNELTGDGTYTYTYDTQGNRLTKRNGNDITTFSYDTRNALVGVIETVAGTLTAQATYTYDVFNNRLQADEYTPSTGTTSTRFAYDGMNVWADLSNANALLMRRLFGDQADQLLARITAAGVLAWYATDHLGSVRVVVNGAGTTVLDVLVYDAYGKRLSESSPTNGDRYGYTGREWSLVVNLQFNRARWYDAATGRWVEQDPWGFGAGDVNVYRYVKNDTTNFLDPLGLERKIEVNEVARFAGTAGSFVWGVNFKLSEPASKKGGVIIQYVRMTWDIKVGKDKFTPYWLRKLNDRATTSNSVEYWEAWEVKPSTDVPTEMTLISDNAEITLFGGEKAKLPTNTMVNDWFSHAAEGFPVSPRDVDKTALTHGTFTQLGELFYVDGLTKSDLTNKHFWKSGKTQKLPSGNLIAYPGGKLNNAAIRSLIASYGECVGVGPIRWIESNWEAGEKSRLAVDGW